MSQEQLAKIARLISFEKQIRETRSLVELQYTITNELRNIIPFTQSFFGYWPRKKNIKIKNQTIEKIRSKYQTIIYFDVLEPVSYTHLTLPTICSV